MILDSSYLFGLLRGNPDAQQIGLELQADGEMQWLPTPTITETCYGASVARPDVGEDQIVDHLRGFPRLDVDVEVARTASDLLAAADDAPESGINVAYVAAMAEILDEPVLAADREPYEPFSVAVRQF